MQNVKGFYLEQNECSSVQKTKMVVVLYMHKNRR
jgi:hypothetical protein